MTNNINKDVVRFKEVFGSPNGKEVLKKLAAYCGLMRTSIVQGDPLATARNEGRREVILEIIKIIRMKEEDISFLVDSNFNIEEF